MTSAAPARLRPRVVIIGAGFGGIAAARALRHAPVDVLVVDQHNYHLFQPLLYQVATAVLDPSQVAHPVRAILRRCPNATFRMGRVTGIDAAGRRIELDDGARIDYDHLVVAAGAVTNYFGIEGLDQHTFALKDLEQALRLRGRVLRMFELADASEDREERRRLLTFAIIGGGPSGVEFAGALHELVHLVLRKDYPNLNVREVHVVLADGQDHVLDPFAPSLRAVAGRALKAKGVQVRLGMLVREVDGSGIVFTDGSRLDAATVVWVGGVRAAPLAAQLGGGRESSGRIAVDPRSLRVEGLDNVYAIGDIAGVRHDGATLPMLAPVAIQGGQHVAAEIAATVTGDEVPAFDYRDKGTMATIGRNAGIAQIGPVRLSGLPGWLAWLFVHLLLLVSFRSRIFVLLNWAWDYLLFERPVRLITVRDDRPEE